MDYNHVVWAENLGVSHLTFFFVKLRLQLARKGGFPYDLLPCAHHRGLDVHIMLFSTASWPFESMANLEFGLHYSSKQLVRDKGSVKHSPSGNLQYEVPSLL